jgi:serine beta-lactamase-like protein LACTB, mitochondrial
MSALRTPRVIQTLRAAPPLLSCALLLACVTPAALFAQEKSLSPEKRAQIEKTVSTFMSANNVPGISAAVVEDGQPVWSESFGMADLENLVPAKPATLYRLASLSKTITATAVMQLWERGKLDLDAPVQKYCPAFPLKDAPITTRELLGHLGGIRHYDPDGKRDIPPDSARHFASMEESLQVFAADPLVAKPGTKFNYSTYGYTVVGCVLEGAAARKYMDYVRENVFRPAGMEHTREDEFSVIVAHRSRWYHKDASGAVRNAGVLDSSYKIPGGGLISSADDMARYEAAILADKLVQRSTRDVMWTPQKAADGSQNGYALGWGTSTDSGVKLVAHTGAQQGTSTSMILAPERNAGVVVLANLDGVDVEVLSTEILKILLNLKP